ncbi:helix-turn-helix transcriptional regulator [Flavobacterium hauense]
MNRRIKLILYIFSVFSTFFVFAQNNGVDKNIVETLDERVLENRHLLLTNPDEAFDDIDDLLKQAIKEKNKEAEVILLSRRCWYYTNNDLKKAIDATRKLQLKAEEYRDIHFLATAHVHFSNIYLISGLPNKALDEFGLAMELINKSNYKAGKQDVFNLRINAYSAAGGAYIDMNKSQEAAKMLLKANREIKKLEDSKERKFLLRINYTNLGEVYSKIDIDSAEYYINYSIMLSDKIKTADLVQFNNYLVLGFVNKEKKNYAKAIYNYKKAESKINEINPTLENINTIYGSLSEIYKMTDSLKQANYYLEKLQNSLLQQEQNKNKSLHKIIDDKLLEEKNYTIYIGIGSGILLLISLGIMLRLYIKNKLLEKQEKADEAYLQINQFAKPQDMDVYKRLAELARNNDQAFIIAFHDQFPDFYDKLLEINPRLVESEIKFCAFLKLKLSTKEIAQIQSIEPATVKNKKNRIRKRLTIPADVELYYFFNQF